jgi:hypothetical protein
MLARGCVKACDSNAAVGLLHSKGCFHLSLEVRSFISAFFTFCVSADALREVAFSTAAAAAAAAAVLNCLLYLQQRCHRVYHLFASHFMLAPG